MTPDTMRIFLPLIFAVVVILVFGLIELLLLRFFNLAWWRKRIIRTAAWGLPLFGMVMVLLWGLAEYYTQDWLVLPASVLAALTFILEVALMLSLPLSGALHLMQWLIERLVVPRRAEPAHPVDEKRRLFLKATAAGLPVATLAMGVSGLTRAFARVAVSVKPIHIDGLPPGLDGLRVLHLSDIHLRHYVTLEDLGDVIAAAEPFRPDLVAVTGDVADDVRRLPDVLSLIEGLRPRLGTFACLGNHEYFRGIAAVHRIYDRSHTPLLVNAGVRLKAAESSLLIAGIDDPRFLGLADKTFFRRCVDEALGDLQTGDVVVVMSHRPDAFHQTSQAGVHLTLAGHTHGVQIGIGGRSLFETVWPERFLWGNYRIGRSHLYTSAGVGHWFPFRLGCPTEAPVIELRRAPHN